MTQCLQSFICLVLLGCRGLMRTGGMASEDVRGLEVSVGSTSMHSGRQLICVQGLDGFDTMQYSLCRGFMSTFLMLPSCCVASTRPARAP